MKASWLSFIFRMYKRCGVDEGREGGWDESSVYLRVQPADESVWTLLYIANVKSI